MRMVYFILSCCLGLTLWGAEARIGLDATINGERVRLGFDTGASDSILFRGTAERLKLKIIEPLPDFGPVPGQVSGPLTEPVNFAYGTLTGRIQFGVINLPAFTETEMDGLLSWYPLRDKVFIFDPTKQTLDIGDTVPETARGWQRFKQTDDRVLGFQVAGQDSQRRIAYLDTGAEDGIALQPTLWKDWVATHTNQPATVTAFSTASGELFVKLEMWATEISIGALILQDVPVREADAHEALAMKPDHAATLGLFALRRLDLVVGGTNRVVYARPRADAPPPYPHNRLGAVFPPPDMRSDFLSARVAPGSPAYVAGIRDNDVLLKIGDLDVTRWRTDPRIMPLSRFWESAPGTELKLTLKRGEKEYRVTVIVKDILAPSRSGARPRAAAEGLLQEVLLGEVAERKQTSTGDFGRLFHDYDLATTADAIMRKITSSPEYADYLRRRSPNVSAEEKARDKDRRGRLMLDYIQGREDVKPEVKAWVQLFSSTLPSASWVQAMSAHRELEKYRPVDFVPKLLVIAKAQANGGELSGEQWNDWLGLTEAALPLARTPLEKNLGLLFAGAGAVKMQQVMPDGKAVDRIWKRARAIDTSDPQDNTFKLLLALVAQDPMAAAKLAPCSRARFLEPSLLLFAGKHDEALDALQRLCQQTPLDERERAGLHVTELLVFIFTHRFDEARRAIVQQRQSRNLIDEKARWLGALERILQEVETGSR
jgi:hypothetical protein